MLVSNQSPNSGVKNITSNGYLTCKADLTAGRYLIYAEAFVNDFLDSAEVNMRNIYLGTPKMANNAESNTTSDIFDKDEQYIIVASPLNNYGYAGLYTDTTFTTAITTDNIYSGIMTNDPATYYAKFDKQTFSYTVEHYIMNTTGGYGSSTATDTITVTAGDNITLETYVNSAFIIEGGIRYANATFNGSPATVVVAEINNSTISSFFVEAIY